ncbi:MAG: hypothetical protein K2K77_03975, partial [Duncaniella sp.]|nr:hypothetical protein [Duncaniella sp.]
LKYIDYQKISKDSFADFCASMRRSRRIFDWPDMKEYLEENMGFWREVPVTEAQTEELKAEFDRCFKGDMPTDHHTLYKSFNTFTDLVYSIQDRFTGLGFTTNGHSGGLVPVYAIGVGAEKFGNMNDNIDLPAKIREIVDIAK